ncbi:DinB family protein [Nocardioides marmoraquaticus]
MSELDWTDLLLDQLVWHWEQQLRPRLDGLTDDEYLWEPAPGSWNLHPSPDGSVSVDFAFPEPTPVPVTTIAWRLAHVVVGIFGDRNARHFGGPAASYDSWAYAATADEALRQLDDGYDRWVAGVRSLDDAALARPCGEDGFETLPMAALVLHVHREVLHHGAELALLRDLWPHRG